MPASWVEDIYCNGDAAAWAAGDLPWIFPSGRHRSKWYTPDSARGGLAAIGIHGQWIYVDRASEMVCVKLATQPRAMDIALDHRWVAAFRAIAAAL